MVSLAPIGIDLGTTNSLISVFTEDGPDLLRNRLGNYLTPSVVSYDGQHLYVGETAKARLVTHPHQTVAAFKRTMGADKTYALGRRELTSIELSAAMLNALKEDAETALGHGVRDAVISVPAYFNEAQRKSVSMAARMADLNPVRLINEPTAAALAYGLQDLEEESCFLVFDLGGGTFDVSILEVFDGVMEVRATAGDAFLGGEDFTSLIARKMMKDLPEAQRGAADAPVRKLAEQAKLLLSQQDVAEVAADLPELTVSSRVSRGEFEELSAPLLKRLLRPVERVLYDARLKPDELQKVVLVGGATRMPVIRSLLAKHLRHFPDAHINPDHAVALGASVQAGLVSKNKALKDVVMTDVTAHSLGIETSRIYGNKQLTGYFLPIIERNTVIPASREERISPVHKNQSALEVNIYQGEAPDVKSNIRLGSLTVNLPRNSKGELEEVSVRFTYDVSGLLDVDVTTLSDAKTSNILIKNLAGDVSEQDIEKTRKKLAGLKVHPRDDEANIHLRARIEQCYSMARHEQRQQIGEMLADFDLVLESQNPSEIMSFREQVTPLLDAFEANYVL